MNPAGRRHSIEVGCPESPGLRQYVCPPGLAFGALLGALYGVLYMLLSAEDYALLAGSVLLFGLLAGVMIATRRVDWYQLARLTSSARTSP